MSGSRSGRRLAGALVVRSVVAVLAVALVWEIVSLMGARIAVAPTLLAGLVVVVLVIARTAGLWPEPVGVRWGVVVDADRPHLPREHAAAHLADLARGAQPDHGFTCQQLREALRTLCADRLVLRHDADPDSPLAGANGLVSPALLAYLDGPDPAPPVRRDILAAYLKEIDSL